MLPYRLSADFVENFRELDRQPGTFLQMMRGFGVRRPVPGPAHGNHQPIKVLGHHPATQCPVAARPFEQFIGNRNVIGHWKSPLRTETDAGSSCANLAWNSCRMITAMSVRWCPMSPS